MKAVHPHIIYFYQIEYAYEGAFAGSLNLFIKIQLLKSFLPSPSSYVFKSQPVKLTEVFKTIIVNVVLLWIGQDFLCTHLFLCNVVWLYQRGVNGLLKWLTKKGELCLFFHRNFSLNVFSFTFLNTLRKKLAVSSQ